MMKFMRRYGWLIFLVPMAVFILDDYATNWHEHGHETTLRIALENFGEDGVIFLATAAVRWWQNRPIPHIHAQCPKCGFRWVMHPKQHIPFCPNCGAPEPP
jgi:rubrerythrin